MPSNENSEGFSTFKQAKPALPGNISIYSISLVTDQEENLVLKHNRFWHSGIPHDLPICFGDLRDHSQVHLVSWGSLVECRLMWGRWRPRKGPMEMAFLFTVNLLDPKRDMLSLYFLLAVVLDMLMW